MHQNENLTEVDRVDAITLEIIQEAMISIVREMRANLVATAYSSIIYEAHDFSCVLVDGEGQIIAQAEDNPAHIFPVPWSVQAMLQRFGSDIRPGDVFLHNDPYTGGTHLNDIAMIFPVFTDGELLLFPVVRAHWGDVGGTTPGSISGKSTEIFHDGIRIPVARIAREGHLDESFLETLIANMRVPRERRGDFMSTWGTCQVAQRRIGELMLRYGSAAVKGVSTEMLDRSERRMRARISTLHPATYVYEHYLDPTGNTTEPVRTRVAVAVNGDSITVDFTGSSPQVDGSMNASAAVTATGVFTVIKAFLNPGDPINHGDFRPIIVQVPEGSFLNARYPASCAGCSEARNAAISAVLGAMSQAMPERMVGDIKGTTNHVYISGPDPRRSDPYLFYEYPAAGTGGFAGADGSNAVRNFAEGDFSSIQPAEAIEHETGLLVERCEIRIDSCGPGLHRGGFGLRRDVRVLGDGALLSISSNKNILPPFGVAGGGSGAPNRFFVTRNSQEIAPSDTPGKVQGFRLRKGDVVSMQTSGGGGFGNPYARDPQGVLDDVQKGYLTLDCAMDAFGVMIRKGVVDVKATNELRQKRHDQTPRLKIVEDVTTKENTRLWGRLSPKTLTVVALDDGCACELVDPKGASLRVWTKSAPDVPENSIGLSTLARRILRLDLGDTVELRLLGLAAR
jgi:N-methylhydantoinase B